MKRPSIGLTLALLVVSSPSCSPARPTHGAAAGAPPGVGSPAWIVPERRDAILSASGSPMGLHVPEMHLLLDEPNGRIYVTGSSGMLEALTLRSGQLVFRREEAAAPLTVLVPGVVAALDRAARLVLLDAADGRPLFVSAPTDVPGAGTVTELRRDDDRLSIAWSVVHHPDVACCGGGIPTTRSGNASVSLRTGAVEQGPFVQIAGEHRPAPVIAGGAAVRFELQVGEPVIDMGGARATSDVTLLVRDTSSGTILWTHPLPPQRWDPRPDPRQRAH